MKNEFGNPVCPHCQLVLTEACFERGKWQCKKCQALLDNDAFDEFYSKKWTWYKGSEEAKSSTMTIYNKSYAQRVVNKLTKSGFEARLVDKGYGNFAVQMII